MKPIVPVGDPLSSSKVRTDHTPDSRTKPRNFAPEPIGAARVVFGLGRVGLNVIPGLRMTEADLIVSVDLNDDKEELSRAFGLTNFVISTKTLDGLIAHPGELTGGGAATGPMLGATPR